MQLQHRPFQESFWPPTASTDRLPDFKHGLDVLHQKLQQSAKENRAIVEFLKRRIAAEQQYAHQLSTMADASSELATVFDADVGASLKKCFEVVRSESAELGTGHRSRADNLKNTALDPLERLTARYERIITHTRSTMDQATARFDGLAHEMLEAQAVYIAKCKVVEHVRPDAVNQTKTDLWLLLFLAQHTSETVSGQTIIDWICANQPSALTSGPAKIAQDLLDHGLIVCLEDPAVFTLCHEYTIHAGSSSPENKEQPTTTSLWGRWSQKQLPVDPKKVSREITDADSSYRHLVQRVEKMRMQTEEALFMHFEEMESLELDRIQTIKQAFISIAAALSNTIPLCKDVYDRVMLYQETLKPEKDVLYIVEQYRTGRFCPRPILYRNHFYGATSDQLFGVPLDDLYKAYKWTVPTLITHGLAVIESGLAKLHDEEKGKVWITRLPLDRVHAAREEVNKPANTLGETDLAQYDLLLLASLIRLYLLELPECLLTFELYEPIKILYANQENSRIVSVSKLVSTLPPANYHTLMAVVRHFHKVMASLPATPGQNMLQGLSDTFGPILVRPQAETTLTAHHRHPQRLMRDLIVHFDDVFTEATHRAQETHVNRRVVVADTTPKEPSFDAPSFTSSLSTSSSPVSLQLAATPASVDAALPHTTSPTAPPLPASPVIQRRSSLLSFMRRNQPSPEKAETDPTLRRMTKAPIPMPSSSTLFEDPDESTLSMKPTASHSSHIRKGTSLDDLSSLDSFFHDDDAE